MIVRRQLVKAKPGCRQQVVDLVLSELAAQRERGDYSGPFRVYTPRFSGQSWRQVILEWEFEDLAEHDQMFQQWFALPSTPAYMEKWHELVEPDDVNEIWNVRVP